MKMSILTLLFSLCLVGFIYPVYAQTTPDLCNLLFGSAPLQMRVLYEDTEVEDGLKKIICADIQLIYSSANEVGVYPTGKKVQEQLAGGQYKLAGYLAVDNGYLKRPDGFEKYYGQVVDADDGANYFFIPAKLSNAYQDATDNLDADAVSAMQTFIIFMNNLDNVEMPELTDLLYLSGDAVQYSEQLREKSGENFRAQYKMYAYRGPSILEYGFDKGDTVGGLVSKIYMADPDTHAVVEAPVIYHDGKWKLLIR